MASTSQTIRFVGPASSSGPGGGSFDALNRIFSDLCTRGSPKEGATLALRKHLEEQARDLSGEAFSRFMDQLYDRISSLLHSNDVAENLGALRAVNELIDVALGENASKVSKFASYMRHVFEVKQDHEVLALASRVLGHLARAGGAMTSDEVEIQVRMALDWLQNDKAEHRLFAAVLILKEMAENASTVFNVHVPRFVDAIWVALRHPTLQVRERAVEALRACLKVIEKRETRWRVQWYYRMFEATQDGLGKNAPVHSIHGSLLAVGELLRNTGEFMMSRYREVAEIVLRYLEHRDRLVRLSITSLLPRIAHFLRDRFVTNYLTICMNHILAVLRQPAERGSGFIALGEMAGALDGELVHYLPTIMSHLRDAIAPRRGRPSMEALACVGNIAKAMGPSLEPHVRNLMDVMFSAGLSSTLVESLEQITDSIPSLLPIIQDRLLDCISVVLSKSHYAQLRQAVPVGRGGTTNAAQQISDLTGPALVQLALQTLARFNFKGHELLEFARESVIVYLDDEDGATRKDAALCCCKLVANSFSSIVSAQFGSSRSNRSGGKRRRLIEELVEKLLIAAVADADVNVRHSIFSSLYENRGFDDFLAQADCLSAVFAALNDEEVESEKMIGRAEVCDGLYLLKGDHPKTNLTSSTSPIQSGFSASSLEDLDNKVMLWHFRFGHPSFRYLAHLFPSLFINKKSDSFNCEVCQYSKHTRSVYPSLPYKSTHPFSIIHSDIWGPSKVTDLSGSRWYITFIDDHSRLTWTYLMKTKSETATVFKTFYQMIHTQFNTPIKVLHTDNAKDYFNHEINTFLTTHGIIHSSSCVETPQQNGIAERKNRHLLEVARALLFSSQVPKYLWGDAIRTATYLINRLPSRVLKFESPRQILLSLFPHITSFSSDLPLKVFGCTAFVHLSPQHRSKLEPRSLKCVFLGYSPNQNGYKCYNPSTRKTYHSKDVTFFESEPYFPNSSIQGEKTVIESQIWEMIEVTSPLNNTIHSSEPSNPSHPPQPRQPDSIQLNIQDSEPTQENPVNPKNPEIRVYQRRKDNQAKDKQVITHSQQSQDSNSNSASSGQGMSTHETEDDIVISNDDLPNDDLDVPIARRKGVRTCTSHPVERWVSYGNLSRSYQAFSTNLDSMKIPNNLQEALLVPEWKQAVMEEIKALEKNKTWTIETLPTGKKTVDCKWIFAIKYRADG
ncbi:Serine/threonine-protein kinase TOR, partial [Linum perenne]